MPVENFFKKKITIFDTPKRKNDTQYEEDNNCAISCHGHIAGQRTGS